jgi:endonuclease/exonuclease/phosphatase family metal-dependent hydrolase
MVCSAHFEDKFGGVSGRWSPYQALSKAIDARTVPVATSVIAGDFNTFDSRLARIVRPDPGAAAFGKPAGISEAQWWKLKLLPSVGYSDPFGEHESTFSLGPLFRAQLDWITVRGGLVGNQGVGSRASSDHRPIRADIRLADTAAPSRIPARLPVPKC